ncbi:MAG: DUF262 domain-containing protein [Muribaculaceae bacterium]|nr:DUF262 domain-containing protein [Muribaculaceae bacterium]
MRNSINQYSIGDLLDGRFFYIPAYQRGYRWTAKQVEDLLRDLLCFANNDKKDFDFYCLQPIIARPITDIDKMHTLFQNIPLDTLKAKGCWEIIDGQQRLTTLFLLYKYLMLKKGWDEETLFEEEDGKELFHIFYATREESSEFLQSLNLDILSSDTSKASNIDHYHILEAFKTIDRWIKTSGKEINARYKLGKGLEAVRTPIFDLLNGMRDTKTGSVQVLWYELAENEGNSIREFQKINTGKLKLTDAELVKGLFLQSKNFNQGAKFIDQNLLASEWEMIENTLHSNSFWYFLQKKGVDMANRIDLIFTLIYKRHRLSNIPEEKRDEALTSIDKEIQDPRKSVIFRFFYDMFEGLQGNELQKKVADIWDEVMTTFRRLDDWFWTPRIYNYIGLLSQCGEDLVNHLIYYDNKLEDSSQEEFITYLKDRVKFQLRSVHKGEDGIINLKYKQRNLVYKTLLTLNVHLVNMQNTKFNSVSEVYKFPFDVLNEQDWDIEHIDSFSTNKLKRDDDKREWINTALNDLGANIPDEERRKVDEFVENTNFDEAISLIKKLANEEEEDDEVKNSICNLTLLDSQTNRSYGNSLFCTKRRIIIDRLMKGVFIPIGTQYVFSKLYDPSGTNRSAWREEDMINYGTHITELLEEYLTSED